MAHTLTDEAKKACVQLVEAWNAKRIDQYIRVHYDDNDLLRVSKVICGIHDDTFPFPPLAIIKELRAVDLLSVEESERYWEIEITLTQDLRDAVNSNFKHPQGTHGTQVNIHVTGDVGGINAAGGDIFHNYPSGLNDKDRNVAQSRNHAESPSPSRIRTDDQIRKAMEHIDYEYWMLHEAFRRMGEIRFVKGAEGSAPRPQDLGLHNALLESLLLHARNLNEFFSRTGKPDDILFVHILDVRELDRPLDPAIITRMNKFLTHVTYERLQVENRGWKLREMVAAIDDTMREFVQAVDSDGTRRHLIPPELRRRLEP